MSQYATSDGCSIVVYGWDGMEHLSQDILVTAEDGKEDSKVRLVPDTDGLLSACWKLVCLATEKFGFLTITWKLMLELQN